MSARRWVACVEGGCLAFLLLVGIVAVRSEWLIERRHERVVQPRAIAVADSFGERVDDVAYRLDPAVEPEETDLVARGRHLVTVVAQCSFCHGPDLAGRALADDPWIGRLHSANLTRGKGGVGGILDDAQWEAALRGGLDRHGRSLLLMPSAHLARLGDRDLAAIVAYVRQVPPVDRIVPTRHAGWLTRVVVTAGLAPDLLAVEQVRQFVDASRRPATNDEIEIAPSAEYGEYLVALGSCRVCHRADLKGGLHPLSLPGEPIPPDLTASGPLRAWHRADFDRAMRAGVTPDGRSLDREAMPWPAFAGLSDLELEAIWRYLRTQGHESISPGESPSRVDRPRLAQRSDGDRPG